MPEKVPIPYPALKELEVIRDSGATNMLNRAQVQRIALEKRLYNVFNWIDDVDTTTYGRGIMNGFKPFNTSDSINEKRLDDLFS